MALRISILLINFLLFGHSHSVLFDTDSAYSNQNENIVCSQNEACIIICDEYAACLGSTMTCPAHFPCNVTCSADYSCDGVAVNCPEDESCSISCHGKYSCRNINIVPTIDPILFDLSWSGHASLFNVTYPIVAVDDYKDFSLKCEDRCEYMNIICPSFAYCNISCIGWYPCGESNITWPKVDGLGILVCDGIQSCYEREFPIPDPNKPHIIQCNDYGECDLAIMKCPTNAPCDVICTNPSVDRNRQESCQQSTIYCPITGDCNVVCSGILACQEANIICPINGACNVSCVDHWSACHQIKIISSDFSAITLNCDTDIPSICSSINFMPPPTPHPTMYPTYTTHQPTYNPSTVPTVFTDFPTSVPSFVPSLIPTLSPNNPTILPANIPTQSPSNNPTQSPTNNQTLSPTTNPAVSSNMDVMSDEKEKESDEKEKESDIVLIVSIVCSLVAATIVIVVTVVCCRVRVYQPIPNLDGEVEPPHRIM